MTEAVRARRRWIEPEPLPPADVEALHEALSLPPLFCRLLIRRGHADAAAARAYLRPSLEGPQPADLLPDVEAAAGRIERAIRDRETVLVHGDYDVDGMASAALLTQGLRELGAHAEAFVPHRMRDGYDLGPAGLKRAREISARLIVTVDCGMTAVEAVDAAARSGQDVIVTDHHRPGLRLPAAQAVVNPHRADSEYPFEGLAGAGVAFKLLTALCRRAGREEGVQNRQLDLVALGTIADRAPLVDENRALVRAGLRVLARTRNVGLRSLLEVSRVRPFAGRVPAEDVAFRLAPRLNAAGRVGAAAEGLRLLLADSASEAHALAWRLEDHNRRRRSTDRQVAEEAEAQLAERFDARRDVAAVLWSDDWHPGVIGIVASKVAERVRRPTVLVTFHGDLGRGSVRSAGGLNLVRVLLECAPLLERYGGHREAAGFDVRRSRFDEFRERFLEAVARERSAETTAGREPGEDLLIDLSVTIGEAASELGPWMRHLEPFGQANPRPVLLARGVRFDRVARVGHDGGHLRAEVRDAEGGRLPAVGFHMGERANELGGGAADIVFELVEDFWREKRRLQARLLDARPA